MVRCATVEKRIVDFGYRIESYMIWSWVIVCSASIVSLPPAFRYLTNDKPRGRPPYW
jgi:hypothetical protein